MKSETMFARLAGRGASLFLLFHALVCHAQTVYYVATNGNDTTGTGTIENPWLTIGKGVSSAASNDTVMVSNGTYAIASKISIDEAISVRTWSDDPRDTVVDCGGTTYAFLMGHADALLAGFTITNGFHNLADAVRSGGIFLMRGTVSNCVITGCRGNRAGGVSFYSTSATMRNCLVTGNTATNEIDGNGGGVYFYSDTNPRELLDCRIIGNTAADEGGGIWTHSTPSVLIAGCLISNNTAKADGGIHIWYGNVVSNCVIVNNRAEDSSGGIFMGYGGEIRDCFIGGNVTTNGQGGIFIRNGSRMVNCAVVNNTSLSGSAGGVFAYLIGSNDVGGVTYGYMESCTIAGNTAVAGDFGGLRLLGTGNVTNTIVFGNTGATYNDIAPDSYTNRYWYCCCSVPLAPGKGNITGDPLFVNTGAGDFRLDRGSPCINAGQNHAWMVGAQDIDGRCRLDRFSGRVDMGCCEYLLNGSCFYVH